MALTEPGGLRTPLCEHSRMRCFRASQALSIGNLPASPSPAIGVSSRQRIALANARIHGERPPAGRGGAWLYYYPTMYLSLSLSRFASSRVIMPFSASTYLPPAAAISLSRSAPLFISDFLVRLHHRILGAHHPVCKSQWRRRRVSACGVPRNPWLLSLARLRMDVCAPRLQITPVPTHDGVCSRAGRCNDNSFEP